MVASARMRAKTIMLTRSLLAGAFGVAAFAPSVGAATVSVGPSAHYSVFGRAQEIRFVAMPGEANDVEILPGSSGQPWTVIDHGAALTTGQYCTNVDAHTVRCAAAADPNPMAGLRFADVKAGDGNDRLRIGTSDDTGWALFADGGAGDDDLVAGMGGGELDGGPGDDRLVSTANAPFAMPLVLDGGGGADVLRGGMGDDTLTDGDRTGAIGERAPGPDVLDGGGGVDTISYRDRTADLNVDLHDPGTDGEPGEGDRLTNIEWVKAGAGNDRLVGNAGPNLLDGGDGTDVLIGHGGDDRFWHGHGPVNCGFGIDTVVYPTRADVLDPSCEGVTRDRDHSDLPAYPAVVRRRSFDYEVQCPHGEDPEDQPSCAGSLVVRKAAGRRRLLGALTFGKAKKEFRNLRVPLTPQGRRGVTRRRGVVATMSLTLGGARMRWTITLRRG